MSFFVRTLLGIRDAELTVGDYLLAALIVVMLAAVAFAVGWWIGAVLAGA